MTNQPETTDPKTLLYAVCADCGADDCRYDEIDASCPSGHPWTIVSQNLGKQDERLHLVDVWIEPRGRKWALILPSRVETFRMKQEAVNSAIRFKDDCEPVGIVVTIRSRRAPR